jgi:hypothetical protein
MEKTALYALFSACKNLVFPHDKYPSILQPDHVLSIFAILFIRRGRSFFFARPILSFCIAMFERIRFIGLYSWALWLAGAHAQTDGIAGPLTTLFTPPASCNDIHTSSGYLYVGSMGDPVTAKDPACYPPGWAYSTSYYPGVCPVGE